jgi:hypothetical protein
MYVDIQRRYGSSRSACTSAFLSLSLRAAALGEFAALIVLTVPVCKYFFFEPVKTKQL